MSLTVSYTTHTVEITASGLAVAAIGNSVEVSAYNHVVQVSPLVYQVSVAQAGVPGPTGPGVPLGGTTGQVMVKLSDADLDTGWGSVGGGDMLKSTYDTDGDGKVNAAVSADAVPWSGVTGKPSTYAPSAHKTSHATGGTDVITPADIGAATASHNHDGVYSSVGHNHDLAYSPLGHDHSGVYAPASHTHSEYSLTTHNHDGVYSPVGHDHSGVYAPASHNHAISDVTNLQTALDGKASTTHNHDSAYAAASHNHDTVYLSKTNTTEYTPTANYHPTTKKYVDDLVSSSGGGDMLKSVYDLDNDGKVDAAEAADSVPWSGVTDKPSTYTPSAHKTSHATGGTDALSPADIGAATASHDHSGVYSPVGHDHSGVYAPVSHSHAISDVTNLQTTLDGKASTTHNHDSAYASITHTHTSLGSLQLTSQAYYDEEVNVTGTTFNLSAGNHQKKTMSANITVSITVPSGPAAGFIHIIGHATNTYTIGWPSSSPKVVWLTTAITSITAGKSTLIAWKYDGTNLWLSCPGLVTTP